MQNSGNIKFGRTPLPRSGRTVSGTVTMLDGEPWYRISGYDRMLPFFLSVVSSSDHWMYLSSRGGITCGRRDPGNALFPYETDDKIHDASNTTGSKSLFIIEKAGERFLWEPFRTDIPGVYSCNRNLYKNRTGNKLLFEEVNHDLGVRFRYAWTNSERFGFVRRSWITNMGKDSGVHVSMIDGIRNILPYGVDRMQQSTLSTLIDGYKRCELHEETGLGIYTLSSILTDRAEPSEALKASTVWSAGIENPVNLLSESQLGDFSEGKVPVTENSLEGRRGAYFVHADFQLESGATREWCIVADVNQGPSDVPATVNFLKEEADPLKVVKEDADAGTRELKDLVAMADGEQVTADDLATARHFSNTLFNVMRGGLFPEGYMVSRSDLTEFVNRWNSPVCLEHREFFDNLAGTISYQELLERAKQAGDTGLLRLVYEYLPLTFSRRHGDPSRPWNQFSIDLKNKDGSRKLNYQGNWRDIFQNWEALAISYPGFIESFIAKFVNASTADGYNPYRITREGIDWEVHDPDDPWSNIGYWGDHQVIYLLRLLELSMKYHPGALQEMLATDAFVYANVPYRIRPFDDLVADPHNSILYDDEVSDTTRERTAATGMDGKLLFNNRGSVHRVNLAEKILVSLLAKLTNFVPGGGIWMNTQRPEWNDANNALAGYGLSMVTLYHLRRFVVKIEKLFSASTEACLVAEEVAELFRAVWDVFHTNEHLPEGIIGDRERRQVVDMLGKAGSSYREQIYRYGFSEKRSPVSPDRLKQFFALTLKFLDHTIATNRRADNLFHSYNLVEFGRGTCTVTHMHEMLEGQVAVLGSGCLDAEGSLLLLDALRSGPMYRADQGSYMLYPEKSLPGFLEKNIIPQEALSGSEFLIKSLQSGGGDIVEEDDTGDAHFNGTIRNAADLRKILETNPDLSGEEKERICQVYESCFKHRQFTGRSGTFFKYEGIGCIYWHMVSKLLLSVQEVCLDARRQSAGTETVSRLGEHYRQIREGLGLNKSPELYGAFPTDPYSHTPRFAGVQQPGMTGQVKEDMIVRFGELGVTVEDGCIGFEPHLLGEKEYLEAPAEWKTGERMVRLGKGKLGFTLCGIPVIYSRGKAASVTVAFKNGEKKAFKGTHLADREICRQLFDRTGNIDAIRVEFPGSG